MENDEAIVQWLNLLGLSPGFVIKIDDDGRGTVECLEKIPAGDGEYWVAGSTILKNGSEIFSVFIVDTDSGGSLKGVYWKINDRWWDFEDRQGVLDVMGVSEENVFPFDWTFYVELEDDVFHS